MDLSKSLEAVSERDVDLLILEEAHASTPFLEWLAGAAFGEGTTVAGFLGAFHSVSDAALGETDLLILFEDHRKRRCAILIENKITASLQPEQGGRYVERADLGAKRGDWEAFRTLIIAPRKYLQAGHDLKDYQAQIPYEDLLDWFDRAGDPRSRYKKALIEQAIDQSTRGYSPVIDEKVTKFFHDYWECARSEFPELEMAEPSRKPANSNWVGFRPQGMPRDRYIWHKMDIGRVDLELKGSASSTEALHDMYKEILPSDTEIARAGKSAAVRIHVPILDIFGGFAEQLDAARAGMRAAYRLIHLSKVIRGA